jgi:hypothetical protein
VQNGKVRRSSAVVALLLYGTVLGFWAASRLPPLQPPPLRSLADGSLPAAALAVAVSVLGTVALFVPVGFLAVAIARGAASAGPLRVLLAEALALAVAASVLLWPGRPWHLVDALAAVLAAVGCTLGVPAGVAWPRGPRARQVFAWAVAAAGVAALVAAAGLAYASVEPRALVQPLAPITSAEKRRLYQRVRQANPRHIRGSGTKTLRLSGRDLDALASWAQTITGRDWPTAVVLGAGTVRVSSSVPLPGGDARRFLNASVEARPAVAGGRLSLRLEALRVGRLDLPRPVLAVLSPLFSAALRHDERLGPFLAATRGLDVQPSALSVTYGRVEAPPEYVADVLGKGLTGEIDPEAVRAHVRHLVTDSRRMAPGERAASEALRSAFAFARERSEEGGAVLENKAGLLALGVLLGHPRLQTVVGPVVEPREWRTIGPALRRPRLRGRTDWTRHFFLSAALTALSVESVSDAAGLFKEELDADGGSGFSFADLLADRAGTCFALAATRDEAAARALQERLASGARLEEFFPPAAGLPEGLTDAELARDYGGMGGEGYRRLAASIESRLPWCPR